MVQRKIVFERQQHREMLPNVCLHLPDIEIDRRIVVGSNEPGVSEAKRRWNGWNAVAVSLREDLASPELEVVKKLKVWGRVDNGDHVILMVKDVKTLVTVGSAPGYFPEFYLGKTLNSRSTIFHWAIGRSRLCPTWCALIDLFSPSWLPILNLISNTVCSTSWGVDTTPASVQRLTDKLACLLGSERSLEAVRAHLYCGDVPDPDVISTGGLRLMTRDNADYMKRVLDL